MIKRELVKAIRFLGVDTIQKVNSDYPDTPIGVADIIEITYPIDLL